MNTIKGKLYTLIKAQIGSETLIFADQNAPRPALPYWAMRLASIRKIGSEYYSQGVNISYQQTVLGVREATLQLQRVGADSDIKMIDLRDNLAKTTANEAWQVQKIAIANMGEIAAVPYLLDGDAFEPRAAMDIIIRFGASLLDTTGGIDQVSIDAEYVTNQGSDITETNPGLAGTIVATL